VIELKGNKKRRVKKVDSQLVEFEKREEEFCFSPTSLNSQYKLSIPTEKSRPCSQLQAKVKKNIMNRLGIESRLF